MKRSVCKCDETSATSLYFLGETKRGSFVFVCSSCKLPKLLVWEGFLDICDDCFSDFSSPWEIICYRCHKRDPETANTPYKGWGWAARQRPAWAA